MVITSFSDLYIHHPGSEILGLQNNYWPEDIRQIRLLPNVEYAVAISKSVEIRIENEKCRKDVLFPEYINCKLAVAKRRFDNYWQKSKEPQCNHTKGELPLSHIFLDSGYILEAPSHK